MLLELSTEQGLAAYALAQTSSAPLAIDPAWEQIAESITDDAAMTYEPGPFHWGHDEGSGP